ncbi:PrpR N-terminal domain-containing protein [Pyramidobacter sp. YE332]|uniref:sigma-54-dependent Fis family transcriptional regulator n=1 Tax=Pyramidobacter sp. YE332 TaxID=3068894 RepID=UPI00294ACAE0|nr:PrpR N-terminal domain-containing protein [Pyramidobacter sp. YE332]WOL40595.1 PrpR N-terminal domain-containing protein [Pyramidobacter sp. YE332]
MKKVRLLCIAPYEGMRDVMMNIAARRSDLELVIRVGDLADGVRAVSEHLESSIDAIISRGGTAEEIRRHFSIPACEIDLSVCDILRAIRLARNFSDDFAIMGYPSITKNASSLCDLLQYTTPVITIHSADEAREQLEKLKKEGRRIVVGDTITAIIAQKLDMNGILVTSGMESIEDAFQRALHLQSYYRDLQESKNLLDSLLNSLNDNLIVFGDRRELCFSTLKDIPQKLRSTLEKNVPSILSGENLHLVRRLDAQRVSIEGKALVSRERNYCVYTLTRQPYAEPFGNKALRCYDPEEALQTAPFENFLGESAIMQKVIHRINRCAAIDQPVLLVGEPGTGKDRFAHYIYAHSRRRRSSLVRIDCRMMTESHWEYLLENENSPLRDNGLTFYIRCVEHIPPEQRLRLENYFGNTAVACRNKFILSCSLGDGFTERDSFFIYLREIFSCLTVEIPPLRRHSGDIPTLVGLYINSLNARLGTQVVGFTPEAMLLLQKFPWERNIDQLVRVVRCLVVSAKMSYISASATEEVLAEERHQLLPTAAAAFNLNRPLNEIVREIVTAIFAQENMNQTKTAKRLGISRSTLWRMLR